MPGQVVGYVNDKTYARNEEESSYSFNCVLWIYLNRMGSDDDDDEER